jgi:hypothetical protein
MQRFDSLAKPFPQKISDIFDRVLAVTKIPDERAYLVELDLEVGIF